MKNSKYISPKVGEIWELKNLSADWLTGLVLEIKDDESTIKTAQITITELPDNYHGHNVEINDSFSTKVVSPFVIHIDDGIKDLTEENFESKRGSLSDKDWKRVLASYSAVLSNIQK